MQHSVKFTIMESPRSFGSQVGTFDFWTNDASARDIRA